MFETIKLQSKDCTANFLLYLVLFFAMSGTALANSKDTVVYHVDGKARVHIDGCRRLTNDAKERSKLIKMTLETAEKKGLEPCSKCPVELPKSWVNPPRSNVRQAAYKVPQNYPLISMDENERLTYKSYSDKGDRILDFSHCGYKSSEVPIPEIPVIITLTPPEGELKAISKMAYSVGIDSYELIQAELDNVAAMPANENGFRGAVLLKKGMWYLSQSLKVPPGVILRGEGDGGKETVLTFTLKKKVIDGIQVGVSHVKQVKRSPKTLAKTYISDSYVPSGSNKVSITNVENFKVGDYISIIKTTNQAWIDELGVGERLRHIRGGKDGAQKKPWKPHELAHIRKIVAIDGSTLTLDTMMTQSISKEHGGGKVIKVSAPQQASNCGVEYLRIVSNYDLTAKDKSKDSDFKNLKNGISVYGQQSWVRNCTVLHVYFAAVSTNGSRYCTIRDCKSLKPIGPIRGGMRYSFNVAKGNYNLFYNCYAEDGRHDFVGGSRVTGPNAFVNCKAVRGGQSEPHHRWGVGFLFDNIMLENGGTLAAMNRGDSGTGHGWAGANTVFWNCSADAIIVFDPETVGENNFSFGYKGDMNKAFNLKGLLYANTRAGYWDTPKEGKHFGFAPMGNGHIESPDRPVEPASLFLQQLKDRVGAEALLKFQN